MDGIFHFAVLTLWCPDKHGELGIWDARAPVEEAVDEDGELTSVEDAEGGKYYRLQMHWPATSKSSISSVKFDPIDAFSVCTVLSNESLLYS